MLRASSWVLVALAAVGEVIAEETFVTIQSVVGDRLAALPDEGGGRGGAMRRGNGPAGRPGGFGRRRRGGTSGQPTIVVVPSNAKITSAMRERRTFEFRVGVELPGGLRNPILRDAKSPLSARIVTDERGRITEVNVVTAQSDINHSNTDAVTGGAVIAVKPKRPPMKPVR